MSFIPDAATLISYTLASLILFVTPGPDMSLFLAKTISGGRWAGIAAMMGALSGCLVHTLAAALGLSALIAASATAFTIVKIVGALYLLWMAYEALRYGSALNVRGDVQNTPNLKKIYLQGIGINLTNPKIVLFFITFLPLFIEAGDPNAQGKLMFLGVYFLIISFPLSILLILGAERLIATLKSNPKILRGIDYVFAGVFGLFAIKILATQAR